MATSARAGAPANLWLVGIAATVWTAFGCYDYVMTETQNRQYLSMMGGEEAIAYFLNFPGWVVAFWAIGVWGGLAGSLALLARSRWAVLLYGASLAGLLITSIYQFALSNPPESLRTPGIYAMTAVIWVIAIALFAYARTMAAKGVLR
jgi:hypothetical protein